VSLPEAATQFGYRIGDQGSFTDAGFIDALDQRTGQRMPNTYFELPPDQGKTKLYFTWRDRRGEQADVVTINFDPQAALAGARRRSWKSCGPPGSISATGTARSSISRTSSPIAAPSKRCATAMTEARSIWSTSCRRATFSTPTASLKTPRST